MEIKAYKQDHYDQCVQIFQSNLNTYFAQHELEEFKSFLTAWAHQSTYFVMLEGHQVVACGGYEKYPENIILSWGMVRKDLHGKGYGKQLTTYRLIAIKSKFPHSPIKIDTSQHTFRFYEKQGFKIQVIEKDGFEAGLDKYTMVFTPENPESFPKKHQLE